MNLDEPLVSIIMGSDSDLPTMRDAAGICREFDIKFEMRVVSAHRTPFDMLNYARDAHNRGIKVIIAGAGGAAHLPGMVASATPLPVIGVPIKSNAMNGLDSLYSIVQMPFGVPVATVAIGGAANAGLLAMKILSIASEEINEKVIKHNKELHEISMKKNEGDEFTEIFRGE